MANLFNTAAQKVSDFANLDKVQALEGEYGYGTPTASSARHQAAMNQLSNAIATPINKISKPLGTFAGDLGAFGLGLINEIPALGRGFDRQNLSEIGADIIDNFKGTFGTPNVKTSENIYKDVYGIPSLDKNLFTQYGYDEDEFSGIEGQTAMINPLSIIGLFKAGLSKKQIAKVLMKDKISKELVKKTKPVLTGILTGGGAKAGAPGGYTGPKTYDFDEGAHRRSGGNRPDKPGGFTDPGKGSYGPHKAYGGRVSYFDGGLLSLWPR